MALVFYLKLFILFFERKKKGIIMIKVNDLLHVPVGRSAASAAVYKNGTGRAGRHWLSYFSHKLLCHIIYGKQ